MLIPVISLPEKYQKECNLSNLQIATLQTLEICGRARSYSKKFPNFTETSFSQVIPGHRNFQKRRTLFGSYLLKCE